MTWYPQRDADWHPVKPTVRQAAFGAIFFLALAGLALYWSTGESNAANHTFLLVVAGLLLLLGLWRIAIFVRLGAEGRRRGQAKTNR